MSERRDRILAVEHGKVICPRQGVVDIARCWICPAYDGLSSGSCEGVVCRASAVDPVAVGRVDA